MHMCFSYMSIVPKIIQILFRKSLLKLSILGIVILIYIVRKRTIMSVCVHKYNQFNYKAYSYKGSQKPDYLH